MIDWNSLIKPDDKGEDAGIQSECRDSPTMSDENNANVGKVESNNHKDLGDCSRHFRHFRQENDGVGLEQENNVPVEGGTSDNYCATETHPANPIAMCLLLTCCNKATISKEETLEAIINLKTIPQSEQIRSWAILCQKHGIDPHRIIYPFTQSPSKGASCQGCKNLEMDLISIEGKRRIFRFVCKQRHHLLEAFYVHERVLIAPESCRDYLPTA